MGHLDLPAMNAVGHRFTAGAAPSSDNSNYWEWWTGRRCITLHTIVVALVILVYSQTSPQTALVFGGVLVAPCFFFFVWVEGKKTFLKITPISVYFVWQGFALGPAAIFAGMELSAGVPTFLGRHLALPPYLAKGYVIGLLGTLFLHAGLQWLRPQSDSMEAPNPSPRQVQAMLPILFVLFCVGCVTVAFGARLEFLGAAVGFFQYSGHGALLCFTLIPARRLGVPEFARFSVLLLGTAVLVLAAARTDSKLYMMLAFIGVLFYVLQKPALRKQLPVMGLALIFVYLTVVAPTVSAARNIRYKDKVAYGESMIEAFKLHSPLATGRFDSDFYDQQMRTLLRRQFEPASIAVIAEEVDLKGFINGETFYQIRYFFIPRLLWPDKPKMVRGGWFTYFLGMSPRESDSTTSIGMEAAGELYWNFGYAGVAGGMFILGVMLGKIWRMSGSNPAMQPLHMALYMFNTMNMMNLPEAASRMASCIAIFVFFGIIFNLMRPRRQSSKMVFRRAGSPESV
jgi:hypothetical protein